MIHRVNAAVFRIGKSLNWHSLGSPLFRWRDLKVSLFLNYFLSRFLEKESYALVRYGLRSEAGFLKIALIAFRMSTIKKDTRPKGLYDPYFETYWKGNRVFTNDFIKIGVFKKNFFASQEHPSPMYEDLVGNYYTNSLKRVGFSISPVRNWNQIIMFFLEGASVENFGRESIYSGVVGSNIYFYIRLVSRLFAIRYSIRKSFMRILRRRILPPMPRVFKLKFLDFSYEVLERHFCDARSSSKRYKIFLFSFLLLHSLKKIVNVEPLLKKYFFLLDSKSLNFIAARVAAIKLRKRRVLRSKKKILNLKKKYFLFKKSYKKWVRRSKKFLFFRRRTFRRGCYRLSKFFRRLENKNKGFKNSFVYTKLRACKVRMQTKLLLHKKFVISRGYLTNSMLRLRSSLESVFRAVSCLIGFFKSRNSNYFIKINFLFSFVLKKIFFKGSYFKPSAINSKKSYKSFLSLKIKKLYASANVVRIAVNSFKLRRFRTKKVAVRPSVFSRINFFFYFFFNNFAIFKFYKLKYKPDSVKYLYRKKKFFFVLEKTLSSFLKTRVMIKFFNPLDCNSMDDLWTKSLFRSLNVVSNMYMRNRLDFKPSFVLVLYTMLAFKYNSPAFLGSYIANQLEWRWRKRSHASFIRILIFFFKNLKLDTIYTGNLLNFSVGFYGKVWGKLRAGKFIIRGIGDTALPLRRVSLRMDTSFTWAESQFGTFGIRIWMARV